MSRGLICITLLLGALGTAQGADLYVPDSYQTIQSAIDSATRGDTVVVRPGTYGENIKFYGKAITVTSEAGPAVTVIDGGRTESVAFFEWNEGNDSILEGFTIRNGQSLNNEGGGILCRAASPTIRGNVIENNIGSGIDCLPYAMPLIENNTIAGNSGRGISCAANADTTIEGNRIERNSGGIFLYNSWSTIASNRIADNHADDGAGIHAVFCGVLKIANNVISGNSAVFHGGGIYCRDACNADLVNNTLVGNSAGTAGGGLFCTDLSAPTATNTIFWNDTSPDGPEIALSMGSDLDLGHCDVAGGQALVSLQGGSTLTWGAGQIDADPLFADAHEGDYHLNWNSPCRTAGDSLAPSLPAEDFEGDPRIVAGKTAIGADAFYFHLYHDGGAPAGGTVRLHATGAPGMKVAIAIGSGLRSQPLQSVCGNFYLTGPITRIWNAGTVPASGILPYDLTLPGGLVSGESLPMQALVRTGKGFRGCLTNVAEVIVE